jgi:hypothetical protein
MKIAKARMEAMRVEFAKAALNGMLSRPYQDDQIKGMAHKAFKFADAMIEACETHDPEHVHGGAK